MVFSSVVFLFYFLPVFLAIYLLIPPMRTLTIVLGSLAFYGWGDPASILLLAAFTVGNWMLGISIARGGPFRVGWLTLGCLLNLGMLVFYKYAGFLLDQVNVSFAVLGLLPLTVPRNTLPLGISFITFQGLSYLIDVSRGVVRAQSSFLKFAMYKTMFPQLIAGPIVRYSEIAGEVDVRRVSVERMALGVRLFVIGLAQKVLLANTLAVAADGIFALPPEQMTMADAWLGAACYTAQIFFDFGGYSIMAIGLGHILGFTLPRNFDNPYAAVSITDFWRRWHMTLSRWFRDYLYIPLGGNRLGPARTYVNLLIVFVLCGLWHGAAWTFVVWGLYHGLFLVAERLLAGLKLPAPLRPLRHGYTMLVVLVGWVFFRADNLSAALSTLRTMAGFGLAGPLAWPVARYATASVLTALLAAVMVVVATAAGVPAWWRRAGSTPTVQVVTAALCLGAFCLAAIAISAGTYNPFIYFRF